MDHVITVGGTGSDFEGFEDWTVDAAVRACGQRGGTVWLTEGEYVIHHAVRLPSHIRVRGSGPNTVLRKAAGVQAKITRDADFNQRHLSTEDGSGFVPGMDIALYREEAKEAWDVTTARISRIHGGDIFFEEYLERDYPTGAMVSNACSVLSVTEAEDVLISDLTIEGSKDSNGFLNGCRGGGIYLYRSKDCAVEAVCVRGFHGDGISWQTTRNIRITGCEISGCTNFGLHPGAGSQFTQVRDCVIKENGKDGLFICWRVKNGLFCGNDIGYNGCSGISIGHKDTDNLIRDNVIHHNGEYGVCFRRESPDNASNGTVIVYNRIVQNGKGIGEGQIRTSKEAQHLVIFQNSFDGT